MGLLDKLLRDAGKQIGEKIADSAGKAIKDALGDVVPDNRASSGSVSNVTSSGASTVSNAAANDEESGFSWGPTMPDEENQYNYNGTFTEYFANIFKEDFSEYRVEQESQRNGKIVVFTFYKDGSKALVVELLSENSQAENTRFTCIKEKIPYTRFYYNHHGWWNTRAYVVKRTRDALNG